MDSQPPPSTEESIRIALNSALPNITHLVIEDQSGGCGEKIAIVVVSEAFEGKGTLARHRMSELLSQ